MSNPALMASAFMSNPFGFAQAMTEEMNRVFSAFDEGFGAPVGRVGGDTGRGGSAGGAQQAGQVQSQSGQRQNMQRGMQPRGGQLAQWMPQMEVLQRGDQLVVRADLPGLTPDDVQIEIEDGVLTVSGERRQSFEDRQDGFYRTERSYGAFSRSIALPDGVNEEQVQARFEHGVLEITAPLPQQPVSRSRRVQVQSGSGASQSSAQQPQQSAGSTSEQNAQGAADLAGQSPS
jgi:HSP20 family protein